MTAQKDQIQTFIAEIDNVLGKASPRLPWVNSADAVEQRQLLERIRRYLLAQQQTSETLPPERVPSPPLAAPSPQVERSLPSQGGSIQEQTAQQILQAVMQEMGSLRASLTQPLQADVEALRQQREALVQELRQLEAQRQSYTLQASQQQQVNEFLQVLMGRVQEYLAEQIRAIAVPQTPDYESAYRAGTLLGRTTPAELTSSPELNQPLLNPTEQLAQLEAIQAKSDQLLMSLDSTISIVFEALQRNVQTYQDSLSQGIEKMHSLGSQGEVMFTVLVNHLAQKLGQGASSYLQASSQPLALESATSPISLTSSTPTSQPAIGASTPPFQSAEITGRAGMSQSNLPLPFPGIELPLSSGLTKPSTLSQRESEAGSLRDLDLEALDLSDLNLSEPDLGMADLSSSTDLGGLNINALDLEFSDFEADTTVFVEQPEVWATLSPTEALDPNAISLLQAGAPETAAEPPTSGSDEALEFLEQLSASLQDPEQVTIEATVMEPPTVAPDQPDDHPAADPEIDRALVELDDFYSSLFGEGGEPPMESATTLEEVAGAETITALPLEESFEPPVTPEPETAPAPTVATASTEDATAALESFLFGSPDSDETTAASNELVSPANLTPPVADLEPETASPLTDDDPESIALLANLLDDVESGLINPDPNQADTAATIPADEEIELDLDAEAAEESYVPAAPDESLLVAGEPAPGPEEIALDAFTLQLLSEDLSNMEGLEVEEVENLGDFLGDAAPIEPDRSLSDLPLATSFTPANRETNAETWEDLALNEFVADVPEPSSPTADEPADLTPDLAFESSEAATEIEPDLTLDAFATEVSTRAPEPAASAPTPIAAENIPNPEITPEAAGLTLDTLDELFDELPASTASPASSPELPQSPEPTPETLGDFFGEVANVPDLNATTPATPDDELTDMVLGALFAESTPTDATSAAVPDPIAPAPTTPPDPDPLLEEFFAGVPDLATETEPASAPITEPSAEEADNLFLADLPMPIAPSAPEPSEIALDSLFSDLPLVSPDNLGADSPMPSSTLADTPDSLNDLFGDLPLVSPDATAADSPTSSTPAPETEDSLNDLFADLPPIELSANPSPTVATPDDASDMTLGDFFSSFDDPSSDATSYEDPGDSADPKKKL